MLMWISFCTQPQSTVHFRRLTTTTQNQTIRRSSTPDRTVPEPKTTAPNHKTPRVAHPKPSLIHPKSPTSFPFSRAIPQLEKATGTTVISPAPRSVRLCFRTKATVSFSFWERERERASDRGLWDIIAPVLLLHRAPRASITTPFRSVPFRNTNQTSREASELRLKRQVVGKCDRSMLLATYCASNRRASNGFVKTTKNLKKY
ncbi:hypothetical protein GBA52_026943 [Prunus armeniaca]|nr:hypothetical protein GBA52_026943 [Prunus armeniaca]